MSPAQLKNLTTRAVFFITRPVPKLTSYVKENDMSHMAYPAHNFFNDLSAAEAQKWVDALDQVYYLGRDVVVSSEDWRKAPVTALLCKQDNAVPPDRQEMVWQGMEQEWIDAAHTCYVSKPEEVAEVLVRLAGR